MTENNDGCENTEWPSEDVHLDYRGASELTGIKTSTLYALGVSEKRIPHVRLGRRFVRFSRRALHQWLAGEAFTTSTDCRPASVTCWPGLEIKANGGYIVAPPSVHPLGWIYTWDGRRSE